MLDFGFSEILLTSAIALVVLGPERLPKVARQVGNWMGRARVMARQLSEQLEREVNAEELLKEQSTPNPPAANRIAPTAPYVQPQADVVAGVDPHAAPHAEYNPPTTVPTTPPPND
jgi:Tat protein translocase TatB subunit